MSASSVPTISARAIRKLLETLPELGLTSEDVCAQAAFDATVCDDMDARVPVPTLHTLWEVVIGKVKRPDAALVVAQHYAPSDYDLVGFVCMASATLREALQHVVRYSKLWTDVPGMQLLEDGALRLIHAGNMENRRGVHMANEAAMAEILNAARLVSQQPLAAHHVCFKHAAPSDVSIHEAFFQGPVRFNQPVTEVGFTLEQLNAPLPRADAQLGAFLRQHANQALAKRGAPDSLMERLRSMVAEELQKGVPELETLAQRLGMGDRTLRRRLEELGTSFREVLDNTRAELARSYVKDRRMPLSEVAFMLGFSEHSTFHRAFKRWTGVTPAAFRQQQA